MNRPIKSMTVAELIEALQDMPPDAPVVFAYNYGDHIRTTVTAGVSTVDEGRVTWSEYHRMFKDVTDEPSDEETHLQAVVIA